MARGRLITIEGIDGAGKSTLASSLLDALAGRGVEVTLLREPGGVRTAERIRELVHDPDAAIDPRTEALLYAAARAQLVTEAIEPLLASGQLVLLDRFVDSSLAYQGGGRELGVGAIQALNEFATGGIAPERTLLLVLDPELGRDRLSGRGGPADRLELASAGFFQRVARTYGELARADPERIRTLDASQAPAAVLADALAAISDLV
ncbi:MAG: dTMP kinase [Solirubrobacteraceae bacterium]